MGGRGSNSGITLNATRQIASMQIQQQPPNIVATQAQAAAANTRTFADTDGRDYHTLVGGRQYFQSQNLTIDQQLATIQYLSDNTENGSLYSMSQNMNHAMSTGQKLTANQQFVHDYMMQSMHNLGENLNLTRYDHAPFVNKLLQDTGIPNANYENMSLAQIKNQLVGHTYGENKFLSTSYSDFKHAPQSTKDVFTTRAVKIEYKAAAKAQAMMPGNGPGGQIDEIVLAPSGSRRNYKITDVKFTNDPARHKGTQRFTAKRIVLTVEVS